MAQRQDWHQRDYGVAGEQEQPVRQRNRRQQADQGSQRGQQRQRAERGQQSRRQPQGQQSRRRQRGEKAQDQPKNYAPLTPKLIINLAAPHTWPAAIMPTLVAVCAAAVAKPVSVVLSITLLIIVIIMQSAVNTFNDYFDYVKGTDSDEDNVDPSDAVLVYNNVNPGSVLNLAIGMLILAFLFGVYPVVVAGIGPLIIALIGAAFVVLYSAGKSPISYLPLGEVVSGVVMGALIPLASYLVLTGEFNLLVLVWSIPTIIGVGLIMFTNNTCDIERDIPAGRKTLPIALGRERAVHSYRIALIVWVVAIIANVGIWFTSGLVLMPFMVLASYPLIKALFMNTFLPERRLQAMPQILTVNVALGAFYAAAILASTALIPVL